MKVIRISKVPRQSAASPLFTGRRVSRQPLVSDDISKYFNLGVVNFGKGIRNKFHTHTSDQVLIVTAGKGIVATAGEERKVTLGDVIHIPAGEKHWHGATKDSAFSHFTLTAVGSKTTQLED